MANIEDVSQFVDSKPEEAAQNIERSSIFAIEPSVYKQHKEELNAEFEKQNRQKETTPVVADYMRQSPEHASLIFEDVPVLEYLEKQTRLMGDFVTERPTVQRQIVEKSLKELWDPDNYTDEDRYEKELLNEKMDELGHRNYGIDGWIEQLPAKTVGVVRDMGEAFLSGIAKTVSEGPEVSDTEKYVYKFLRSAKLGGIGPAVAMGLGFTKEMFDANAGGMFNEFSNMTDDKGKPLNIDHQTKKYLSLGVGVLSAALENIGAVGAGKAIAAPFMTKYIAPRMMKQILNNPTNAALRFSLMEIGKGMLSEGGTELAQEAVNVVAEEIGKTYDGSEVSMLNGVMNAGAHIKQHGPRLLEAGTVGALASGLMSAPSAFVGYRHARKQFKADSDVMVQEEIDAIHPVNQSFKIMQATEMLENMGKVAIQTKTAKVAPKEMSKLRKMFFENAGVKGLFLNWENLKEKLGSPEKAERVRQLIDPSGTAVEMNAPPRLDPEQALRLVQEEPEALNHLTLEPEGPSRSQAEQFIVKLEKNAETREQVLVDLGAKKMTEVDAKTLETALNSDLLKEEDSDINWLPNAPTAEFKYMNSPTFTKAIANVLSDAEVEKFNGAQKNVRTMVAQTIKAHAWRDMMNVQDMQVEEQKELRLKQELDRLENNPNYAIVDKFRREQVADSKGNKAASIYAIDPRSLSDEQLKYLDHARMKEHKAFAKPGSGETVDNAARMLGLNSGDELLQILSKTPTRTEVATARANFYNRVDANQINTNAKIDEGKIVEAFDNNTKNHILEMKFMREKEWSATKTGIKRIALPLPQIKELNYKARSVVRKMRVRDLNVQQFKVGERQSQRMAVNAILKNEVEVAFKAKENAALNSAFQKETHLATGKANRAMNFIRRMKDKSIQRELRDAGKIYEDAYNELADVFNFDPSKRGLSERDAYIKFVRQKIKAGEGNFEIPEQFSDARENLNELSVEGLELISGRLAGVLHLARMKNRLFKKWNKIQMLQTEEAVSQEIVTLLQQHPNFDPNRIPPVQDTKPRGYKIRNVLRTFESSLTNMEHILRELDEGKLGGFFQQMFMHPLKGDGEFDKVSGYTKELMMTKKFKDHLSEHIKVYGEKDFNLLESTILDIPEFRDSQELNYGKLTKGDLMTLWAYGGDPYTRELRGKNMNVSEDLIRSVLDRELEARDVHFMQKAVIDYFKNFREETADLHMRTTGEEIKFVEGVPNNWRGQEFEGGYVPAKYRFQFKEKAALKTIEDLESQKAAFYDKGDLDFARRYALEQTEQGRLIQREGSDKPLDLSMMRMVRGNEEIIHDLSYREAVRDTLKLLRNEDIRTAIISTVGEAKYGVLVDTTIEMAQKIEAENANYFSDQSRFFKQMFAKLQSNFSISVLGLNLTSTGIQYQSISQLAQNMGPKGIKHLLNVNKKMVTNPKHSKAFYDFANELDPTIGRFVEQLQENVSSTIYSILPSKGTNPKMTMAKRAHERAVALWMSTMSMADVHLKMMGALAGYEQFMAGDLDGFPLEVVQAMSVEERHQKAEAYVRQLSRLSLTHGRDEDKAAFQKNPASKFFANYWNDLRNVLNNQINQGRKIKWKADDALQAFENEDVSGGFRKTGGAVASIMGIIGISVFAQMINDVLRGEDNPVSGLLGGHLKLNNLKEIEETAAYSVGYMSEAPKNMFFNSAPFLRDVDYAANSPRRSRIKQVTLPVTKVWSDLATVVASLPDLLSDDRDLTPGQERAWWNAVSYFVIPLPVNGVSKGMKWVEKRRDDAIRAQALVEKAKVAINEYLADPPKDVSDENIKELQALREQLSDPTNPVTPELLEKIKQAQSGGVWNKTGPMGEAGFYQFTEEQWKGVMREAPQLGLTENGRVSKDQVQQDIAINFLMSEAAEKIEAQGLRATNETLYASHLFGVDKAIKLYQEAGDKKAKTILSEEELAKLPEKFKTIGQVRKYLKSKVNDNLTAGTE
jgi:hypothetical protein